jgi:hypothetical protein
MNLTKKIINIVTNDPFGNACAFGGGYSAMKSDIPLYLTLPVAAFGVYHLANMFNQRNKLDKEVTLSGLNEAVLDKYNRAALCARWMVLSYLYEKEKYKEFKSKLKDYPLVYYLGREKRRWKILGKMIAKRKNPLKAIFK